MASWSSPTSTLKEAGQRLMTPSSSRQASMSGFLLRMGVLFTGFVRPLDIARPLELLAKASSGYEAVFTWLTPFTGVNLVEAAVPIKQLQFAKENGSDTVVSSYGVVTAQ